MSISVSLFDESSGLCAAVLYGQPVRTVSGEAGACAHFTDTDLVLYQLRTRRLQTFLFRGYGSVCVPGVSPSVNLIAHATNAMQSRKLVRSVQWLAEQGFALEGLTDAVWLRISGLLNQEKYGVRQLRHVLDAGS